MPRERGEPLVTYALAAASILAAAAALVAGFYGVAYLRGWRIGRLSWPFAVKGQACRRCTTGYRFVRPHDTPYELTDRGTRRSMRPLCERCWADLATPDARYPFYADVLMEHLAVEQEAGNKAEVVRIRQAGNAVAAALRVGG